MFFKIIKKDTYRLLIQNYHQYSRLRVELSVLDAELGDEFPMVKEITAHLRRDNAYRNVKDLRLKLRENKMNTTFLELLRQGKIENPDKQSSNYIEAWHKGDGKGLSLSQYLGMNALEYSKFLRNPDEFFKENDGRNKL